MFVLILNHARYPANPWLIEGCLTLKYALELRCLAEILLYSASLRQSMLLHVTFGCYKVKCDWLIRVDITEINLLPGFADIVFG